MGSCSTEGLSATATTTNQLSGIGVLYDAAGNVTNDGIGNTPTYDAENRIVTDAGFTYSYDADGTRMEKSTGSSGTMYWPGPSGTLAETDLTGTINEEYIYFNGQRIARVDRPSGTVHYYFSNHLGSHAMVTSAAGVCEQDIDYYPYGGVVTDHCPTVAQHYKFTGKERDAESGFDNFGARYDASSMGRFMTPDAFFKDSHVDDPQSWNEYAYARNNPLRYVDPNGENATVSTSCSTDAQSHTTCNVNITASIAIYAAPGSNLTQDQLNAAAGTIQNSIQNAWTGSFNQDGVTYNVATQVNVSVAGSQDAAMSSGAQNVFGMTNGPLTMPNGDTASAYTNEKSSLWGALTGAADTGMMDINSVSSDAKHEFARMLGTGDQSGFVLSNPVPWMRPAGATSEDYGWGLQEATQGVNRWLNGPQSQPMHYGEFWEKPSVYSDRTTVGAPYLWWK